MIVNDKRTFVKKKFKDIKVGETFATMHNQICIKIPDVHPKGENTVICNLVFLDDGSIAMLYPHEIVYALPDTELVIK